MGGHGGLNILPQKRWNVYNFDNREKVRKDEESAAREEQIKRQQSLKRDSEIRLLQLRRNRGLETAGKSEETPEESPEQPKEAEFRRARGADAAGKSEAPVEVSPEKPKEADARHINLFDGIKIFDVEKVEKKKGESDGDKKRKMMKMMRMKKEEVRVVGPEDEKYRLGYGVAGKGVKAPWYAMKKQGLEVEEDEEDERESRRKEVKSGGGEKRKKSVEELREERLKRERGEKERERALLMKKDNKGRRIHAGDGEGYRDRYYRRDR